MKKILILIGLLLLIFGGFVLHNKYSMMLIPTLEIEDERVNIDKLYIYGTHLNLQGNYNFDNMTDLVLYDGEFISYKFNSDDGVFNLSEYVNDGIYLDDIPNGHYYMFFRTKYIENDEEKYKYYGINNNTEYDSTTYYTINNYNKKITIDSDEKYKTMMLHVNKNKDKKVEVYDIVIDPGHGGLDGGASKNGYKETDFTMKIATKLKSKLENYGFKVKLTHEEGQLSDVEKLEEYGVHGRAVVSREVNAKYLFSIHLNSSNYSSVSGLELYTAKNINYDFSKYLVKNITTMTDIRYSNNKINKIDNGIYSRNFTNLEVEDSINDYIEYDLEPYDVTTNSNYYYMIRETGGIVTGAYVDDRNSEILSNPYVLSNVGTEAYLLELGYLSNKNDLNNMINNTDKFVDAIAISIKSLYKENN